MKSLLKIGVLSFFLYMTTAVNAQSKPDYNNDVSSIENITGAMLESISGEKGQKRDWKRFENLFLPTAQLNAVFHRGDSSFIRINTVKEFVEKAGTWYEDHGFREFPIHAKVEKFGNIAHIFQTYGAEYSEGSQRGINSIQLAYDKGRWWIVNLLWDSETPENLIPEKYLK